MTPLAFRVYGVPLPKGNMRPFIRDIRGMKIPIVTESNRNVKAWQQLVAEGASHEINARAECDRALFAFGVRLSVAFHLPRPKKYQKRGIWHAHCHAPDVDKLARAVLDALTKIAFHDDGQVTELIAAKYYAEVDAPAYADICVEAAPPTIMISPRTLPLFEGERDEDARSIPVP